MVVWRGGMVGVWGVWGGKGGVGGGGACDSDRVTDQIDLIWRAGQFLILHPQDISEWI